MLKLKFGPLREYVLLETFYKTPVIYCKLVDSQLCIRLFCMSTRAIQWCFKELLNEA